MHNGFTCHAFDDRSEFSQPRLSVTTARIACIALGVLGLKFLSAPGSAD
jgi:hypothetical protein